MCLGDHQPDTVLDRNYTFLHNYGANRWFDKSLQIVVSPNADTGIIFEHSWGDSGCVVSFIIKVYRDSLLSSRIQSSVPSTDINQIHFDLTDRLKQAIDAAKLDIKNKCRLFFLKHISLAGYDAHFWKQNGLSPNGALQLALQIAYYRLYGRFDPTF